MAKPKAVKYSEADLPAPGSVYLMPLEDGRYGVVRVLRRRLAKDPTTNSKHEVAMVLVAPSSWVGANPARPSDEEISQVLTLTHHSWKNARQMRWTVEPPPASFVPVGTIDLSEDDQASDSVAYGDWHTLNIQVLIQWQWDHDREGLLAADQAERAAAEQTAEAFKKERALKQKSLTLEILLTRTWFEEWDDVKPKYLKASRELLLQLVQGLLAAPKLDETLVEERLRVCVEAFNALEEKGSFIYTTHCEDIIDALDVIMSTAGYPGLVNKVDAWRDW